MKVPMSKVVDCQPLYNKLKSCSPPIKTSYKIYQIFEAINSQHKYYSEKINEIIDKYGARDADGKLMPTSDGRGVQIQKNDISTVEGLFKELMELEVDMPDVKLTLDELESADLTIEEVGALFPFIEG